METGSGCFLSLGALTQQIRTLEGKRKNSDSLCETGAFHQATVSVLVANITFAIMFDTKTQCVNRLKIKKG